MMMRLENGNSLEKKSTRQEIVYDASFLTIIWMLTILIVNPIGNFPLTDDFSYAAEVKNFLDKGVYRPVEFGAMTRIVHILWGIAFTEIFGFSFTTLRISNLLMSLFSTLLIYFFVRSLNPSRWLSVFAAAMVAYSPIYLPVSFSFLTDITFIALMSASCFFLTDVIKNDSTKSLLIGTAFSVAAILCRQVGLAIPIAFLLTMLIREGFKKTTFLAFFSVAVSLAAYIFFSYWLKETGKETESYGSYERRLFDTLSHPDVFLKNILNNTYVAIMYIGLLLSPIAIVCAFSKRNSKEETVFRITFYLTSTLLVLITALKGSLMPVGILGGFLNKTGIGIFTLKDSYILGLPHLEEIPKIILISLTILSVVCGSLLTAFFSSKIPFYIEKSRNEKKYGCSLFMVIAALIYLSPIILTFFWDRYLVPASILLMYSLVCIMEFPKNRGKVKLISTSLIVGLGLFAMAGAHDYLAWNEARWKALSDLMEEGIAPSRIDGGFEFNGWYLFAIDGPFSCRDKSKSWWWVCDDEYIVSFGDIPNYKIINSYEYDRWLTMKKERIFVMERN